MRFGNTSQISWNKAELAAQLTQEFWVMELYRTVLSTVEGILTLLFFFALGVLIVLVVVRKAKLRPLQSDEEVSNYNDAKSRIRNIR